MKMNESSFKLVRPRLRDRSRQRSRRIARGRFGLWTEITSYLIYRDVAKRGYEISFYLTGGDRGNCIFNAVTPYSEARDCALIEQN